MSPRHWSPCISPEPLAKPHVASGPTWLCHEALRKELSVPVQRAKAAAFAQAIGTVALRRILRAAPPTWTASPSPQMLGLLIAEGSRYPGGRSGVLVERLQLCPSLLERQAPAGACGESDPGLPSEPVRRPRAPARPFKHIVPFGPHHVKSALCSLT